MLKKISLFFIAGMFVLGISKASLAMMCGGNAGHSEHTQVAKSGGSEHGHEAMTETQSSSKEAVNVGNKICPVSGEKINEKLKATYEYEGKIYNFCCPMCIGEFKKNPQKYIKKVNEELQAESEEKTKESQHEMQLKRKVESSGDQDVHRGHHH